MPTVNPVESIPRKGRGRPRKKPVEIKGLSGIKLTEDLSTALSPIALTCMEPKKKRGRPRKYPAPSNSKHLPGTDTELGNDSVCLLPGSIDCGLGPIENTGSGANITHAAVDAASPVPLSGQRGREQPEKEVIHIDNSMQSGQSDVGSMLPTYILPESSNKSNSTGPRRRGRPRKKPFPILLGNGSLEVWEVPSPSMIPKIYSSSSKEGTDPRFLKLKPVFSSAKVALWKFSANLSFQGSKPFMCVTAESAPIRTVSWAPSVSKENMNTFVTAGEDGLKFWDLRDPVVAAAAVEAETEDTGR
uniref:Uncharacterized protein n=1 Tax=Oryza nivara TaxID=4536 RepID=A0A0E0I016_ORYNI